METTSSGMSVCLASTSDNALRSFVAVYFPHPLSSSLSTADHIYTKLVYVVDTKKYTTFLVAYTYVCPIHPSLSVPIILMHLGVDTVVDFFFFGRLSGV